MSGALRFGILLRPFGVRRFCIYLLLSTGVAGAQPLTVASLNLAMTEDAGIIARELRTNAAVAGADKKSLGDKWKWDKQGSAIDITPLVAATLAAWGYRKVLFEKPKAATPWIFYGD